MNSKKHFLGLFDEEDDAARAYDDASRRLRGAAAKCNFLQDGTPCPRRNKTMLPHNMTPASLRQAGEIVVNYTAAVATAAEKAEALQHGDLVIVPAATAHVHAHGHQRHQQQQQHQQQQHQAAGDDTALSLSNMMGDAIVSPMEEMELHGGAARMIDHSDADTVLPHHGSHHHTGPGSGGMGSSVHGYGEAERGGMMLRSHEHAASSATASTAHLLLPHMDTHAPYDMGNVAGADALPLNAHTHY